MNFDFNDDQRAIKDAGARPAGRALPAGRGAAAGAEDERGFTDEQWDEIVSLGWPGIFVAEEHGGQGLGVVELVILAGGAGLRARADAVVLQRRGGPRAPGAAAATSRSERWLAPLAAGELRGTLAMLGDDGPAEAQGDALTGAWAAVPDAGSADVADRQRRRAALGRRRGRRRRDRRADAGHRPDPQAVHV